jgi:hypothetical protein
MSTVFAVIELHTGSQPSTAASRGRRRSRVRGASAALRRVERCA